MPDEDNLGKLRSANETRLTERSASQQDGDVFKVGDLVAVGHYRIVRFLGRGAIGSVFCVAKADTNELFALKTLNNTVFGDTTWMRFQKEIDAATRLNHPNLVKAVDFGLLEDERPFMVMEFVEGITLSDALRSSGRLSTDDVLEIFIPLAGGLAYAHREKVVHRDLKPSNIMLQSKDGQVIPKLVDFGIARVASESGTTLTQAADVFGTPLYMSPEQCVSAKVDHRSDIYSLGCVMFEALTGAPPFVADNSLSTMMMHRTDKPASLSEASLGVNFGKDWEYLVAKMLAKDPAQRYQSCEEILLKLKHLQTGDGTAVTQEKIRSEGSEALKKPMVAWLLISLAAVLLIGFSVPFLVQQWKIMQAPPNSKSSTPDSRSSALNSGSSAFNTRSSAPHSRSSSSLLSSASNDDTYFPRAFGMKRDDKSFHTLVQNGVRTLAFPSDEYYGVLVWWDKNKLLHKVNAIKPQTFPAAQKLILELSEFLIYEDPLPLSMLKDGDVSGIRIGQDKNVDKINGTVLDTNARLLSTLAPIQSLNLLDLDNFRLAPSGYGILNQMSHLRWFRMNQYGDTNELAKMSFIPNLRTLILVSQKKVEPVLARLNPTILQTLVIEHCLLGDKDWRDIGKLHSLKTLVVRSAANAPMLIELLHHVAPLRHIERLSVCLRNVKADQVKQIVSSFNKVNFQILVIIDDVDSIPPEIKTQILNGLKGRDVIFTGLDSPLTGAWYNYSQVDPASLGTW